MDTGHVNTNDFVNVDKYMCIRNSIFAFFRWCECQRYQVDKFLWDLITGWIVFTWS